MANFDAPWDGNYEFDPEIWLQILLAMTSDKNQKEKMIERVVKKTGVSPEKAEVIIARTMEFMANTARSN